MNRVIIKYLLEEGERINQLAPFTRDKNFKLTLDELTEDSPYWVCRNGYIKLTDKLDEVYFVNENKDPYPILLKIKPGLNTPKEKVKYQVLFNTEDIKEGQLLSYIEIEEL